VNLLGKLLFAGDHPDARRFDASEAYISRDNFAAAIALLSGFVTNSVTSPAEADTPVALLNPGSH
jgi:hypothetical protein